MYYTLIIQYKNEKDWSYVSKRLNTTKRQDIFLSKVSVKDCDLLYSNYGDVEKAAFELLSGINKENIGYLKISVMNSYNMDKEKEVVKFWDKTSK
jgi:hypothetical protein